MSRENLWAPWRMQYIRGLPPQDGPDPDQPCFMCEAGRHPVGGDQARQRLVLLRDDRGLILLNRYPYTSGHLLVAVQAHLAQLSDLSSPQRAGLMELVALAEQLVRTAFNPQGINIGINLGRCAGAGLPGHLHVHIVPRWNGDTNFMQTVGRVQVIPQALEESLSLLSDTLAKMRPGGE